MGRRAVVVTNPFDTSALAPDRAQARTRLLEALNLPRETRVVGYFANFIPRKRPEIFVEVASRLEILMPGLVCPMFGDPRDRGRVDEFLTSKGIETLCPIMGFCTPILPWMAACDVMLAPAVQEPYGRTIIEAMLVGTPIVASADGGNPEIIAHGETGLLVEPDNVAGFENAVAQLLCDPEEARGLADRARNYALERYSVERHVQDVLAIYRDVAGRSHSR
jgi:glycosyltransferase involved in cell wall biosynthesis